MNREICCTTAIDYEYPPDGGKVPVLDAYDGCQLRCPYCFQWNDPAWNAAILIKTNFPDVLAAELAGWDATQALYVGSRSDPYQPLENTYGLTRRTLEVLLAHEMPCFISTKADTPALRRDFDLFEAFGERLIVCIGQSNLAHPLTSGPAAALPNVRIVHELVSRGITVWVFITPVLPGITDVPALIGALPATVPVFLDKVRLGDDPVGRRWFAYMQRHFPALEPRYRALVANDTDPEYAALRARYQDDPRITFVFGEH